MRTRPRSAPAVPEVLPPPSTREALQPIAAARPGALALRPGTIEAAARIVAEGTSPATLRAYDGDMAYWRRWAAVDLGEDLALPVEVGTVVEFIVRHLEGLDAATDARLVAEGVKAATGPHSVATVARRVASLSKAHQVAGLETANPCRSAEVRELLARSRRRATAQGQRPRRKAALTLDRLEPMLATCGEDLAGIRDRALLLFAFGSGGRRRSEVTAACVEDLQPVGGEDPGFLFRLARSKTDQAGAGTDLPVLGRAGAALARWLAAAAITSGPIFRRIDRRGRVGTALSAQSVRLIVQRRAQLAGLDVAEISAHSLRSGFLTESGRAGVPLADAMALSGHRSVPVAVSYFRAGSVLRNPAARLAG